MVIPKTTFSRLTYVPLALLGVLLGAHAAFAATLSVQSSNVSVTVNGAFTERVVVSSTDQAMNAVSGTLTFPAGIVQVVGVSKGATIPLWVQDPAYSNSDGTITFSGVVPNPGYQGSGGTVITVVFRAISPGTATLRLASASVLANDGQGTEILTSAPSATITAASAVPAPVQTSTPTTPTPATKPSALGPLTVTSPTHPNQSGWYNRKNIIVMWQNPDGVKQTRTGYDTDPSGTPGILYTEALTTRSFTGDEGITYFHVQVKDASGWGPVATYRFNIDAQDPELPVIKFIQGNPARITFSSTDTLSGMQGYEVRLNDNLATTTGTTSTLYNLSKIPHGMNTVEVIAIDAAGNRATSSAAVILLSGANAGLPTFAWHLLTYSSPIIILLILLLVLVYLGWFLWNRFHSVRARTAFRSQLTDRALTEQFAELRDSITEEEGALNQLGSVREFTIEEKRFFKRFTTQLEKAEEIIARKVTHIPD